MTNQSAKKCIILIIVLLIVYLVVGRLLEHSKSPLVKTYSNKDPTINSRRKFILYNFYNPSCPYCQKFLPTWNILVQRTREIKNLELKLVDVTKIENENLAFYYNVTRVPSIILVAPNNVIRYMGECELENLINFIHTYVR